MSQVSLHSLSFRQTLQDHLLTGFGHCKTEVLLVQVHIHIQVYAQVPVYALPARQVSRHVMRYPMSHAIGQTPREFLRHFSGL